jgi:hypothetical protein
MRCQTTRISSGYLHNIEFINRLIHIGLNMLHVAYWISFTTAAADDAAINDDANKIIIKLSNALISGYLAYCY